MDRDYEQEALADGWAPKEDWKGDPEAWVDAEEFVRRGETIRPILQAKNRKLQEQVDALNKRVEEALQANSEFKKFTDAQMQRQQQEKERLLKQLEAERAKAVSDGDGEAFARTDQQINKLKAQETQERKPNPEFQKWLAENSWYNPSSPDYDRSKAVAVNGFTDVIKAENPGLVGKDFLDACVAAAMKEFPEKFGKKPESVVETPTGPSNTGKIKSFDDLPEDAKEAYAMFKKNIPGYTQEEYLKGYMEIG